MTSHIPSAAVLSDARGSVPQLPLTVSSYSPVVSTSLASPGAKALKGCIQDTPDQRWDAAETEHTEQGIQKEDLPRPSSTRQSHYAKLEQSEVRNRTKTTSVPVPRSRLIANTLKLLELAPEQNSLTLIALTRIG
jgi:hypothetical protein